MDRRNKGMLFLNYLLPSHSLRCLLFSILTTIFLFGCGGESTSTTVEKSPVTGDKANTPLEVNLPVISLIGDQIVTVVQGESYIEQGAEAVDYSGKSLVVTLNMELDLKKVGEYLVTYLAIDNAGNEVTTTRTINVIADGVPPVITINGDNPQYITIGNEYAEAGASAIDYSDGEVEVLLSGTVDTNNIGVYSINYTAFDNVGNEITATRTVKVKEKPTPFITVWKTDNFGVTEDNQIKIMTQGVGYDYEISWGDGIKDTHVSGDIIHTYTEPGTYTVSILGDFPHIYNSSYTHMGMGDNQKIGDAQKLLSIEQWGNNPWKSMSSAFMDCKNLVINATDVPDLTHLTDMSYMFMYAKYMNKEINNWDVSSVTNMRGLFKGARFFNQDLNNWDVSNVNEMSYMFYDAGNFNQNISDWDVSKVTNMSYMFYFADNFNQPLGNWDVFSVEYMNGMFYMAEIFNQDIGDWDVSSVISMYAMFVAATAFNQNIGAWDVSNVKDMMHMFAAASAFNKDIGGWNVSNVINMKGMFDEADNFNQDIGRWVVSNVTNMRAMFSEANSFNQAVGNWDVSKVKDMGFMFYRAKAFNQNLSNWNVSNVSNMDYMFFLSEKFDGDISNWDVSEVLNMQAMFSGASGFNQDLSLWNVSSVKDMDSMLSGTSFSTTNYNSLLINWSALILQENIKFSVGSVPYSNAAGAARSVIKNTYSWIITDGGLESLSE